MSTTLAPGRGAQREVMIFLPSLHPGLSSVRRSLHSLHGARRRLRDICPAHQAGSRSPHPSGTRRGREPARRDRRHQRLRDDRPAQRGPHTRTSRSPAWPQVRPALRKRRQDHELCRRSAWNGPPAPSKPGPAGRTRLRFGAGAPPSVHSREIHSDRRDFSPRVERSTACGRPRSWPCRPAVGPPPRVYRILPACHRLPPAPSRKIQQEFDQSRVERKPDSAERTAGATR